MTLASEIEDFHTQMAASGAPPEIMQGFARHAGELAELALPDQPAAGDRLPDFELPDALGRAVKLSKLLEAGPVVLTFYRGEWCPYCNLQLHAYQATLPEILARGASLVAVSPQTPDHSLSMAEEHQLAFAVLTDSGNRLARSLGLVFTIPEADRALYLAVGNDISSFNGDESWELPVPATFVIGRDGAVALAFVDPDYRKRLEPAEILAALDGLPA